MRLIILLGPSASHGVGLLPCTDFKEYWPPFAKNMKHEVQFPACGRPMTPVKSILLREHHGVTVSCTDRKTTNSI